MEVQIYQTSNSVLDVPKQQNLQFSDIQDCNQQQIQINQQNIQLNSYKLYSDEQNVKNKENIPENNSNQKNQQHQALRQMDNLLDQTIQNKKAHQGLDQNQQNIQSNSEKKDQQYQIQNEIITQQKLSQMQNKLIQQLQTSVIPRESRKQKHGQQKMVVFKNNVTVLDVLDISKKEEIKFGQVLPGNIFEESLDLFNKTNDSLAIKISVVCHNQEFEDHDEYVYSIRKSSTYDYNEKYIVLMPPFKQMSFKVALKVPNTKNQNPIKGSLTVQIQGMNQQHSVQIYSMVEIPQIQCNKELFASCDEVDIIKVAIKKGKKLEIKIPFKNLFAGVLNIESELLDDQQILPYDLILQTGSLSVQQKGAFLITMGMKYNIYYQGSQNSEPFTLRKVLLLKIKNSSLIFHYPLEIEIY